MIHECTKVIYNHQLYLTKQSMAANGATAEEYEYVSDEFTVGLNGVERITQDFSDPRVFNIHYADNTMETIFNAHRAFFNKRGL